MVKQPSESLSRRSGRGTDASTLAGRVENQSEAARRKQSLAEKMRARTQDATKQDGDKPA
ncbi:hypothetical protein [Catenuloplanes japonicus]|uniref:hypothetical protein n=1 Tax=Catenuloplanes japonicus TaxID=33876 RepID=UPI000527ED8C|nr:hypothetical protein [Catenuloplanes japonicus]